ncbi:MAG: septum formation initiator family protein [Oliverpabstia sp.]|nr:septum formation initiator family protein [Oliverpabstia sp.]
MKKKRTAAKRKNTKARRTDTQNKAAMIGISGVVSLLVIALLYQGTSLQKKIEANEVRKTQIAEAYAAEQKRTEEIEQLQEEMQSDEYYEKIAKEKIGLVKDNEILFKENK